MVAFLRAINVGGRVVKMDRLRALFEGLGFDDVETFIASGNVIFEAPGREAALQRAIQTALEKTLGYGVGTYLRTPGELEQAIAASPFKDETPGGLYVGFGSRAFTTAIAARIKTLETDVDRFAVSGREVYWRGLNGLGQSKVTGAAVEKALGSPVTFRSITTVRKLASKYKVAAAGTRTRRG
jgi:uncharacterized protein (DUF1697 family)